jgi:hypothetical protein
VCEQAKPSEKGFIGHRVTEILGPIYAYLSIYQEMPDERAPATTAIFISVLFTL